MTKKAYARAGVDVDLGNTVKERIHGRIRETHGPEVLGRIGGYGGLFAPNFSGMREPVLVASVDGVGTKLKIAFAMKRHDTVGADLVNHCVNDIAVLGARPLFFLDYIGAEKLEPRVVDELLRGFTRACRTAGCALIGGETAQMPDMYRKGEYDLAGCIVGVVDRTAIIDGRGIKPGDAILGLPSNGLHTNGYSLARKFFFEKMRLKPSARVAGLRLSTELRQGAAQLISRLIGQLLERRAEEGRRQLGHAFERETSLVTNRGAGCRGGQPHVIS